MSANATTARSEHGPFYRRRGFWRNAVPVLAMVAAFVVGMVIVNSFRGGVTHEARIPAPKDAAAPKTVNLTPKEMQGVHGLITRFVHTAVARKNLAASYALIGPGLKQDISRKSWMKGQVTVQPFPVDGKTTILFTKPDFSYAKSLRMQVKVITPDQPNQTKLMGTETFFIDLVKMKVHGQWRWLVDSWVPRWTPSIPNANG
jgi:hypothetical protein